MTTNKRLFFALEVMAPWPSPLPEGRLLQETQRHLTLAFLGQTDFDLLKPHLNHFPLPPFQVGPVGYFDDCLFLPPHHPRVVSWSIKWWEQEEQLKDFQHGVVNWLQGLGFSLDQRPWLPHVSICRWPFHKQEWKKKFIALPFIVTQIHLYESLGNLDYQPCWSYPLAPAFEELEHTADIAFRIQGSTVQQILLHAFCALAFKCPDLVAYFSHLQIVNNLDDAIIQLNEIVSKVDRDVGCSFKAVSFNGELKEKSNLLTWDMIVDV